MEDSYRKKTLRFKKPALLASPFQLILTEFNQIQTHKMKYDVWDRTFELELNWVSCAFMGNAPKLQFVTFQTEFFDPSVWNGSF